MVRPLAALVALTAAASVGWWLGSARSGDAERVMVADVVDGDTVEVAWPDTGRREVIRLLGVDTPETVHPDRPVECFGAEAAEFTRNRLAGRPVTLEFDRETRDRYGRLLAFVAVDGRRINDDLLAGGYARLLVVPPNGARARAMLDLELEARAARRGLWGAC